MSTNTLESSSIHAAAAQAATRYLHNEKAWADSDYSLEFLRVEGNASCPVIVFEAVHKDDLRACQRGGGKSLQLHVDPNKGQVVRELGYQ
jgi:hypothetical protein